MSVLINASTSTGLIQSADTSGIIELQNNGTTRLTVNSSGATIPTATVTTLNTPTGVLATQNGMTGIAKAWASWTGTTGAIRGSFNVSSVTRNGTGDYTVNFTTTMADANYSVVGSCSADSAPSQAVMIVDFSGVTNSNIAPTTSAVRAFTSVIGAGKDVVYANIAIFGN